MPVRTLLVTLAIFCFAPSATAFAMTATITGDDGGAVPLDGAPTIHSMGPAINLAFAPDEARYAFSVQGPTGDEAAAPVTCNTPQFAEPQEVYYRGNGAYTVIVKVSKDPDDANCAQATESRFTFTIDAHAAVHPPPGVLLTSKTVHGVLISYPFPVTVIPGADTYDLQYAVNAKLNPDGSIAGDHAEGGPDRYDGTETLTFGKPGRYTFVTRAGSSKGETRANTPWSAPVFVTVMAPFGVDTVLHNAHIRTVQINGNATEETATGTMTASIAQGAKGKKFRKLATVKLGRAGTFKLKFRVKKPGPYRIKYVYKSSSTVVAGSATEVIKLKR